MQKTKPKRLQDKFVFSPHGLLSLGQTATPSPTQIARFAIKFGQGSFRDLG